MGAFVMVDFVMGDFVVDPMPRYLKFSLRMLRFLKIFPAHFQKSKIFPGHPVSLDYVLFTSAPAMFPLLEIILLDSQYSFPNFTLLAMRVVTTYSMIGSKLSL